MSDKNQKKPSGIRLKNIPKYIYVFIIIEFILYLLFMYMDFFASRNAASKSSLISALLSTGILTSENLKYYSVIICLFVSAVIYYKNKGRDKALLAAAMLFTAFSDYFLLLNPDMPVPGLASFCVVHCIYLFVILKGDIKRTGINTLIRISIAILSTLVLRFTGIIRFANDSSMTAILFLVILYGLSFISNILLLLQDRKCEFAHPLLFFIGLFLFLLCDLNVLIYNLGSFINISSPTYIILRNASIILMWGFYLPSQVIIVLSAILP